MRLCAEAGAVNVAAAKAIAARPMKFRAIKRMRKSSPCRFEFHNRCNTPDRQAVGERKNGFCRQIEWRRKDLLVAARPLYGNFPRSDDPICRILAGTTSVRCPCDNCSP